jgi:hypothetical protein
MIFWQGPVDVMSCDVSPIDLPRNLMKSLRIYMQQNGYQNAESLNKMLNIGWSVVFSIINFLRWPLKFRGNLSCFWYAQHPWKYSFSLGQVSAWYTINKSHSYFDTMMISVTTIPSPLTHKNSAATTIMLPLPSPPHPLPWHYHLVWSTL